MMIIVLLASLALLTLMILNDLNVIKFQLPYDQFIALAFALIAFVSMILFFCGKASYLDGESSEYIHLGVGAVFCALSSLFAGAGLAGYGVLKILKK